MIDVQVITRNKYNYYHNTSTDLPISNMGLDKLVQEIVLHLKRTPNRDVFDPAIGSSLRQALPLAYGSQTKNQVFATIASSISKIKSDILSSQSNVNLDPREKLQDIELMEATFDPNQTAWFISIRVTNQRNDAVEVITLL